MHHRPLREERILGVPGRGPVLRLGVLDVLARQRVLQLHSHHREPVDPQHDVERVVVRSGVALLAGDGEPVGPVPLGEQRRQPVRRTERAQEELAPVALHPVAQHVDRPAGVDLLRHPLAEPQLRRIRVGEPLRPLVPLVDLGLTDERHQLRAVDSGGEVEVLSDAERPPRPIDERRHHLILEVQLLVLSHQTPISPVTAAVINACLRSRRSAICAVRVSTMASMRRRRDHTHSTRRCCSSIGGTGTRIDSMSGM